jgi:16S rRNA U516 pseudouridylate synthase RsuA-like enzyme
VATDILCASKTISQALIEGGWMTKEEEAEDSGDDKKSSEQDAEDQSQQVIKMVRDSLNETNVRYILFNTLGQAP